MITSSKSQIKMIDMKKEDTSSDDELNDDDEALLEQCIQAGITGVNVVGLNSQVFFSITKVIVYIYPITLTVVIFASN